ncbi:MAG: hypothetical protein M3R58_02495 [Pseudomonadota bacterium]|nr:hypothetical protein [Pseudomonadota bacterium]
MKRQQILAAIALAAPLAVLAQTSYPSREAPYYRDAPSVREAPMTREELRDCMDLNASMRDQLEQLDRERQVLDRETDAIARSAARLADELRNLDSFNSAAVASYNARSAEHNRAASVHNRRVADMNARASFHNDDAGDVSSACASRYYLLRDRDALRRDRGSIR